MSTRWEGGVRLVGHGIPLVGTGGNAVLLIGNFPPLGAKVVDTGKPVRRL